MDMPYGYNDCNGIVKRKVSITGIECCGRCNYRRGMVARLKANKAKPRRIFFREWREKHGLTQEQLAEAMGTTKATVSRIESGRSQYNRAYIEELAAVLAIDVTALYFHPDQPSADALLNPLSPARRQHAISVLEALVKPEIQGH